MTAADVPTSLRLSAAAGTDLATFVGRAQRVDPSGSARLVATGALLAAYTSPVNGGGGPTILALRVQPLVVAADLDTTVPLVALSDRFARLLRGSADVWELSLPPSQAVGPAWAGLSPPRAGWTSVGELASDLVKDVARRRGEEIVSGAPDGSGAAAVARLRALVWGRPLTPDGDDGLEVPSGVAFALDAMGFVGPGETVPVHAHGPWRRVSTPRGYVLARPALF
jgi:hypothetical protein